jgi:hypothetical protein
MAKRKFQLSESNWQPLLRAYTVCKDGPTRTRFLAVRLYDEEYAVFEIKLITGCNYTGLMEWCSGYQHDLTQGLVDKRAAAVLPNLLDLRLKI